MICPHCHIGIEVEWIDYSDFYVDPSKAERVYQIRCGKCPVCHRLIAQLLYGSPLDKYEMDQVEREEFIFPKFSTRLVHPDIPNSYRNDFVEACEVINTSAKASAALSRRLLQTILREEYGITKDSLAKEIEEFISRPGIPTPLSEEIDAIRKIGNFATHPLKDTNTGEIVEVEPGEADWLLDVIESLLDFTFVQPKLLAARKEKLNAKLTAAGKPLMK